MVDLFADLDLGSDSESESDLHPEAEVVKPEAVKKNAPPEPRLVTEATSMSSHMDKYISTCSNQYDRTQRFNEVVRCYDKLFEQVCAFFK